jgi:sialate O-acetylesterase
MPDLPFLIVQIAPYDDPQDTQNSAAFLREVQSETAASVPGVMMVVTTDCGEKDNIHPQSKLLIGDRLYRKACRYLLKENIAADSPRMISAVAKGAAMHVEFDVKGAALQAGRDGKDESLFGFSLAGEDGIYYPASAAISGKLVIVQSEQVASPCFVRYAFGSYVRANLYNDCGMPAEPLRSPTGKEEK